MQVDALVVVSFGGPEGPEEVEPFLDRVLEGRQVPPERRRKVAAQYLEMGGVSPINAHNRQLVTAVSGALARRGRTMRVYLGNRNSPPYLADTLASMAADGVRTAAAFVTSAYSSYSGCRQYLEDIDRARALVGERAPQVVKLRQFFDHPGFVGPLAEGLEEALASLGGGARARRVPVLMSAHSIPEAMAATCDYQRQLARTARLVADAAGVGEDRWSVVYQSRSGRPGQPWLGPDVNEAIAGLPGATAVVVVPIGFVSDHMEVVYDLDRVAASSAASRGLRLLRSPTPGTHPRFVEMVCELLEEPAGTAGAAAGSTGPRPVRCAAGCCARVDG